MNQTQYRWKMGIVVRLNGSRPNQDNRLLWAGVTAPTEIEARRKVLQQAQSTGGLITRFHSVERKGVIN